MINCVFAEEHDVLDKLSFLFKNPDALDRITISGSELVHRCHTIKRRDQILQWYELNKTRKPHQKIVQTGAFGPLRLADSSVGRVPASSPEGLHLHLLRQGDRLLWKHDYPGAERFYLRCVQHIPWMPEPKLRLALCKLYEGNPKLALSWISETIQFTLCEYGAVDPDPVEWAYFIICTICVGKLSDAIKCANQFPELRHPELDRTRQVTMFLVNYKMTLPAGDTQARRYRHSIHQLPERSEKEWLVTLRDMLMACNRRELADRLSNYVAKAFQDIRPRCGRDLILQRSGDKDEICAHGTRLLRTRGSIGYFKQRLWYSRVLTGRASQNPRWHLKAIVKHVLFGIEATVGYFLPHQFSSSRNDEFFRIVYDLARGQKHGTALVIGADCRERSTQALLAGFREREQQSPVFCLRACNTVVRSHARNDAFVKWYGPSLPNPANILTQIMRIKEENNIVWFDIVLVNRFSVIHEEDADALYEALRGSKYVLLENVSDNNIYEIYRRIRKGGHHFITEENPSLRSGYAVFEQHLQAIEADGTLVDEECWSSALSKPAR
jgi:hypothetical protein